MSRFRLTLEYAGTRYSGWQIQKNARTVQGELARSIREAVGHAQFELYGSGRTDAGVHALAQVAHLELQTAMGGGALQDAINDGLPADIHVLSIEPAAPRFHARHDAVSRSYLYQISSRRTAFGKPYVWWIRDALAIDAMDRAARLFVGMHDFGSFSDRSAEQGSTQVLVEGVSLAKVWDLVLIRIQGSHFLWKMVRRMVGVLVEVGRGKLQPADVERFLTSPSDAPARLTAPPSGLFLERVLYRGEPRHYPLDPVLRVASPELASPKRRERRPVGSGRGRKRGP